MSVAAPAAAPRRPALARPRAGGPGRLGLLFAAIVVTSVSAFALSLMSALKPLGHGGGLPGYAAIAPHRDYAWAFFVIAGVQLIIGACAAALASLLLARERGARWATAGASLVWLGAALYGVGIGGWAALYYFGTDPRALSPAAGARLFHSFNHDGAHMLAVPFGGALIVAIGSLLIAVALLRARSVPRWVPIVGALSAVATVLLPPDGAAGLVAEAASSVTTIAIGWYAWHTGTRSVARAR
jgi:hypothetical protein